MMLLVCQFKSNHLLFTNDKHTHKIVVLKDGNQYSVIGIKHITQKTSRLIRRQYNLTGTNW